MSRSVIAFVGLALAAASFSTPASAMPKWERALLQRYVNNTPCNGKGAPAWGKAAMERWRAAQRGRYARIYDAY